MAAIPPSPAYANPDSNHVSPQLPGFPVGVVPTDTDVALHMKHLDMARALYIDGRITIAEYGAAAVHFNKVVDALLVAGGVVPAGKSMLNAH